jgi:ribosomal protein S18 acetylase RimI-like enzyme
MLQNTGILADYKIRPLTKADQAFLWEMLYQSFFVPEGKSPFERNIVNRPENARYVEDWGCENDSGFVAVNGNNQSIGAVWLRLFKDNEKGFGYVDAKTPEFGIAVLPEYRGKGLGTILLSRLIEATEDVYEYLSLSVADENPAQHLYRRLGFEPVRKSGGAVIMKRKSTKKMSAAEGKK